MDKYFIYDPDYKTLFAKLNKLIGSKPFYLKGLWIFPNTTSWLCRCQTKLFNLASKLREHDIPCDNLIIDFEWEMVVGVKMKSIGEV